MNKDVIPVVLVSQGQESVTLCTTPEISLPSGVLFSVCFALNLNTSKIQTEHVVDLYKQSTLTR